VKALAQRGCWPPTRRTAGSATSSWPPEASGWPGNSRPPDHGRAAR